jgi:EAL domain-containing protein (putative c-di-GMP-specific phosphodiesterase class I)
VVFTEQLGTQVRKRTQVEQELRKAIAERQFVLHYQPIVALDDPDSVLGFEALFRWNHPVRGLLSPAEFIDVAEESGLILFIGDWVLREACARAASWHWRTGGSDCRSSASTSRRNNSSNRSSSTGFVLC